MSLTFAVVCGSVREDRKSIVVANFLSNEIKEAGHTPVLVDFEQISLPFVDTSVAPGDLNGNYPYTQVLQWSEIAKAADGFILVAPEYNHGYSAVLKNGLDWLYSEFDLKPVGLVGVSNGLVGGARVIEQLRALSGGLGMYDIKETVMFREVQKVFTSQGELVDDMYKKQTGKLIARLVSAANALKSMRSAS